MDSSLFFLFRLFFTIRTISKLVLLAINWYGNTDLHTLNPIRFRPCCCSRLFTDTIASDCIVAVFVFGFSPLPSHCFFHLYSLIRVAGLWALSHQGHSSPVYSLGLVLHAFCTPPFSSFVFLFLHSCSSRTFDEKGHYPRTKNIFQSCTVALVRRSSQLTLYFLYLSTYVLRTFTPLLLLLLECTYFTELEILGAFC